ncbi:MAG: hypothetical protein IPO66_03575 [Rhodanobacteraceae bacterium]|nr:hypothetical protein [Rhodanobacteraceae bacterium]
MTQRFILSAAIAASLLVFCSGPLHAQSAEASLLISNESNRDFKQLYLSSDAGLNWGEGGGGWGSRGGGSGGGG